MNAAAMERKTLFAVAVELTQREIQLVTMEQIRAAEDFRAAGMSVTATFEGALCHLVRLGLDAQFASAPPPDAGIPQPSWDRAFAKIDGRAP